MVIRCFLHGWERFRTDPGIILTFSLRGIILFVLLSLAEDGPLCSTSAAMLIEGTHPRCQQNFFKSSHFLHGLLMAIYDLGALVHTKKVSWLR